MSKSSHPARLLLVLSFFLLLIAASHLAPSRAQAQGEQLPVPTSASGLNPHGQPPTSTPDSSLNTLPGSGNRGPFNGCNNAVGIDPANCTVLVALYNNTGGAGWTNNTDWLATDTPCLWYGVTCTLTFVSSISLSNNHLVGTIPAALGTLTELETLDLGDNQLSGTIPTALSALSKLTTLLLNSNQLTGAVPSQLGNLTLLQKLGLGNNLLTGSLPASFGNLSSLTKLSVCTNHLSGVLPPELGNLTAIQELRLCHNQFTGNIPVELGSLATLETLYLYDNQLTGSIPTQFGSLTGLVDLRLGDNQLTGSLPVELTTLPNLSILRLNHNSISGSIPPEIGNLTSLTELLAADNDLTGSIPVEIGNLTGLTRLNLCRNDLDGSIPTEIGNLTALTTLRLCRNNLTGVIPTEIGNLTDLTILYLYKNQLSGDIPASLNNLTSLEFLALGDNTLTGSIPTGIGNMTGLQYLSLAKNELTGAIPAGISNLTGLTELYLNNNHLSGSIPPGLGNLTSLVWLYLYDNQLSGSLPPELGNLTALQYLGLSLNQLSGDVPSAFTGLSSMVQLYIDYNLLTASDPSVKAFLDTYNPGWDQHQTVIPSSIDTAFTASTYTLTVGWQTIPYTWDDGYYEVECDNSLIPTDSYMTRSTDKNAFSVEFIGLPVATYNCMVRTVTLPTPKNQNTLTTAYSAPVVGSVTAQNPPPNDKFKKPELITDEPQQFYQANFNQATPDSSDPVPPATCSTNFDPATAQSLHYEIPPVPATIIRGGPGYYPRGFGVVRAGGPGYYTRSHGTDTSTADTVLAIYQVNADESLTLIVCNDDGPDDFGGSSFAIFERNEASTYHIIVWAKDDPSKVVVEIAQTFLTNPGFDVDTDQDKLPDGWTVKNPDAVKMKCNEDAFDAPCSLQIKGNGLKSKLKQKLEDVSTFTADHEISLTGYIKRKKVEAGGSMIFKLTYADSSLGNNGKEKLTYSFPPGTSSGYEVSATDEIVLAGDLAKAIVQISYNGVGGKLWLDALQVTNTTKSADETSDPPDVPEPDPTE